MLTRWRLSESIRLIQEEIPYVKTVLRISDISFGLADAAREVVDFIFLYYRAKAGLDWASVSVEKWGRLGSSIPEAERGLAEALPFTNPCVHVPIDHPHAALLGVHGIHHSLQKVLRKVPEDWREGLPK